LRYALRERTMWKDSGVAIQDSFVIVRHPPKSAKHMFVVEFTLLEIAGATERNSTSMTKNFPLLLRSLYRDRRAWAVNGFASNKPTVRKIECQCHEPSDLCHRLTAGKQAVP
jgi:hypothetical protein